MKNTSRKKQTKNYFKKFDHKTTENKNNHINRKSNFNKKSKEHKHKNNKELLQGTISGTAKGFVFCRVVGMPDFFIPPTKTKGAINGDTVLIKVISKTEQSTEAQVVKIVNRANERLVGELFKFKNEIMFKSDNAKISKYIKIEKGYFLDAKMGEKIVCKLTYQPENNKERFVGRIVEILGESSNTQVLELALMREYNIYEIFPKEVIDKGKEVSKKGILPADKKGRLDLTSEEIFTIDGENAKDFDDAVSLSVLPNGNYYLGVHIADVGHYVTRGGILDEEAYLRGTSVYFPTMTFPMLPESLSNDICSLNENVERLTLSCFMEIDKNCNVVNHKVAESVIKSKARLTYTQVANTLQDKEGGEKSDPFKKTLKKMNILAKMLKEKRAKEGELDFDIAEPYFLFDENNEIVSVVKRERNDAHKLIENFMILCNEVIAKEFFTRKIPFVYRVHEVPTKEKASDIIEFLRGLSLPCPSVPEVITPEFYAEILKLVEKHALKETINKVVLRSLQKARYSNQCLGHFGLALKYYCHFTSPIRRYPDLTIHRIIKDSLHGKNVSKELNNFVFEASEQSSVKEKNSEDAERAADDLKKAEYMKKHIGEEFVGTITSVTNFGFFVELENTIEGLVRVESLPKDAYLFFEKSLKLKGGNHTYNMGDKVEIKVLSSNVFDRKIDFVLKDWI